MEATSGSITEYQNGYSVEHKLFTYSEEEQEENKIARETASMVLKPEFIPIYPKMLYNGYSLIEATLFGFIKFFLANNERFYCTNEQLAQMLNVSEKTISLAITKLKETNLIEISYRMKAGGGKIRFIKLHNVIHDTTNCNVATLPKHTNIENKKIENKNITIHEQIEFEEFRMKYPIKKGKAEAMKKRNKMTAEEKDMAYKSIDLHQQYDNTWKKGFIPYGSTYLNQKRREDEIDTKPKKLNTMMYH